MGLFAPESQLAVYGGEEHTHLSAVALNPEPGRLNPKPNQIPREEENTDLSSSSSSSLLLSNLELSDTQVYEP